MGNAAGREVPPSRSSFRVDARGVSGVGERRGAAIWLRRAVLAGRTRGFGGGFANANGRLSTRGNMSRAPANSQVGEAVRECYRVFKPYRVRRHPEGCPCCVSDADKLRLFSRPLAELTVDDLGRFAWKALTTWGTIED